MSEWNVIDLHIHTSAGYTRDKTRDNVNFSYSKFYRVIKKYDIKLMAITNHNYVDIINYMLLRHLSKIHGTNILMGVELDSNLSVGTPIHIACICNEDFELNYKLGKNINGKTALKMKTSDEICYTDDEIINILKEYDVIMIPHGDKDKGVFKNAGPEQIDEALKKIREGFIRIFDSPSNWKLEKIKAYLESLNETNLDIFGGVLFSDNRDWDDYDKKFKNFCMNAEPTFKGLLHSTTNPVKRFKPKENINQNNNYISKIIIKEKEGSKIKKSQINLSSGYNCIIGKSGTGKSLLIHLIRTKLDKTYNNDDNYSFANNSEIELYNENGKILTADNINIGIGEKLFDKIITATSTNDAEDYYKIIDLLSSDFVKQKNFVEFKEAYNKQIKKYCLLVDSIANDKKELNSKINKYNSNIIKLISLKDIKTFNVKEVENKHEEKYATATCDSFNQYSSKLSNIKPYIELYKGKYLNQLKKLYEELSFYMNLAALDIKNDINQFELSKKKVSIINKAIRNINATKSKQAEIKSEMLGSIPVERKEIISLILNIYKNTRIKSGMKLSVKGYCYNSETIINEKENIIVKEVLDDEKIVNVNEKDNDFFDTYGKKGELSQYNNYNLKDEKETKKLIDKYIEKGIISSQKDVISSRLEPNVEVLFDGQNVKKLNPGSIAKKYIELYFEEQVNSGDKNVVIFDQIENDVDKDFINNVIRNLIEDTKGKVQLIVVTHDPIVAVNADPNNYIESKKNGNIIEYRSFVAESSVKDELETIACTVDGSKEVIRGRYEIYEGDKNYGN